MPGTRWASFFDHARLVPVFAPTSPNNLEYLLAVAKNWAHPLHVVHDDGKGGCWKWWESTFCVVEFSYFGLYKVPCREGLRSTTVYLGDFPW